MHNLRTTLKNIQWNINRGIKPYRLSSELIPLATHKRFSKWQEEVGWYWYLDEDILGLFEEIKKLNKEYNLHLTLHPGQYTVLNSPNLEVVTKAKEDLEYHKWVLDKIGGEFMVIHVGGVYGDKRASTNRYIDVFNSLPLEIQNSIVLENDDKSYNFGDIVEICQRVNKKSNEQILLPLFDYHHERCNPSHNLNLALLDGLPLWTARGKLVKVHLSSGKRNNKDRSHPDYVEPLDLVDLLTLLNGVGVYQMVIMLECKMKNLAVGRIKQQLID